MSQRIYCYFLLSYCRAALIDDQIYGKMLVTNLHDSDYVKKNDNDGKLDHYENDSKGKHDSRKSIVVNDKKSRVQL